MAELKTSTVAALLRLSAMERSDWGSMLEQILRVDAETLGVARVSYWTVRQDPRRFFCELGYQADADVFERGTVLEERFSPAYFEAVRELQLIDVVDVGQDPRTAELRPYLERRRVRSLLDVPIWVGGEPAGVLCHEHVGSERQWTRGDREFALAVGQVLVAALQTRERTRAELSERRSVFLNQAATVLTSILEVQQIERLAVHRALPTLGDGAMLDVLVDGKLRRSAVAHVDATAEALLTEATQKFPPHMHGPHLTTAAIRLRSAILVPTVARALTRGDIDPEYGRYLLELGIRSSMAVPMKVNQTPIGAMLFFSTRCTYEQSDLRLAEEYVDLVCAALENARLFRRARDAIRARDEFISLASHELRTPLTALRASAEALASGLVADSGRLAGVIVRQVDRLDRLAQRMIDTTQIGSGTFTIHPERVDLTAIVRDVEAELSDMLAQAGCTLSIHIEGPVIGHWDVARVETVVVNLLENALKFGKGKPIEVSVTEGDTGAVLTVRDHGMGVPPEDLEEVFGRYERGTPAHGHGGLGLGLYVVSNIVRAHGGSVHASSHPGGGTVITVELPHRPSDAHVREAGDDEGARTHRR